MKALVVALTVLTMAQADPSGMTYEERLAYGAQFIAQAAQIAREHCGEPYFGTICDRAPE